MMILSSCDDDNDDEDDRLCRRDRTVDIIEDHVFANLRVFFLTFAG